MNRHREVLLAAASGTFLVVLAYTIPLGALDATARGLAATASSRAWLVSSMSVGLACTLLPAGAAADNEGRKRTFIAGAIILAIASAGAALSWSTAVFSLARAAQGVGGAALTASSLGIIGHTFSEPAERARATGLWGASLGAGIAAGPVVAASLDLVADFRAAHWLTAALAVLVALAAGRLLPESRAARRRAVDVKGTALLMIGLSTLLGGLVELRSGGGTVLTALCLAAGVTFSAAFVVSQARGREPMIDLALFRRAEFTAMMLAGLFTGLGIISLMSFMPTVLTVGQHRGLMISSLATVAWSGVSVITAILARRLPDSITPRRRLIAALIGLTVAQASLGWVDASTSLASIMASLTFAGLASGVLNATLARQAVASVPPSNAAMGSGANNAARYVGAAFGATLVSLLIHHGGPGQLLPSFDHAAYVTAGFSLLGAGSLLFCYWSPVAKD